MQELIERKENWEKRGYQHQLTLVDESEIRQLCRVMQDI